MIQRVTFLILVCCFASVARSDEAGATNYFVQSWQVEEGLPYGTVHRVLQDGRGFIWLATAGGLVRFDGIHFKEVTSSLVAGVAARNIRSLALENPSTLVMLPAVGGVVRYENGAFTLHPVSQALEGKSLDTLFVEPGGAIWVGLSSEGVARWDKGALLQFGVADGLNRGNTRVSFATDAQHRTWIASGDYLGFFRDGKLSRFTEIVAPIFFVAPSRSNGVWIVAGDRLYRCDDGKLTRLATALPRALTRGGVRAMLEDSAGIVWIGTSSQGLFRLANNEFVPVRTSQSTIASLAEDHEGNLWVATSGGLNRLRPKFFRIFDSSAGLVQDVSEVVCEDERGDVWLGNRSGGLARIRDGQVAVIPFRQGKLTLNVSSVCADDRSNIWVGASSGLYRFARDTPDQIERVHPDIANVHVLFKTRRGDIWVGAERQGLGRFRHGEFKQFGKSDGFTGGNVRAVAEDARGRIWVGTESGELFRVEDDTCRRWNEHGSNGAPMLALHIDAENTVWIGTAGSGLLILRNERLTHVGREDGLPDDVISQITEDDFGRLWVGARRGIFWVTKKHLLDFADGRVANVRGVMLGKSEGLSGVYCLGTCQPMVWKARDGKLWFATHQGVLSLNPAAMKSNLQPPPVYIDEFLVKDQPVAMSGTVKVPARSTKLEFRFAALSYAAPEKVRVRHRLDGVDSDWVETTGERSAVYGRAPPGHYRMHVMAANNDGVWNETGATLAFIILPAWWQTWWFYGATMLAFSGALTLSVRYWSQRRLRMKLERLEHQQALEKERARIARDLHDDLGASLTQIGLAAEMSRRESLSPEETKQQSAQVASRVRNLARELDAIVWTVNPKNDSLDKLASYLCQFSQEFFRGTAIRCRLDVVDDIPAHPITPEIRHDLYLVTKEAMNNVVKHSGATEAWLRLRICEGLFSVTIEDNGRGFSPESMADSERNGLRNMRARIEELGGQFEIVSRPGEGTSLALKIPLRPTASGRAGHSIER